MYVLRPFFTSPSAPTTIGTVDVFICHIFVTSISRSLYLDSFSTSLIDTFLSDGILMSIMMHFFSFLSLIIMSGLLAFISLSVLTGMSHNKVAVSFLLLLLLLLLLFEKYLFISDMYNQAAGNHPETCGSKVFCLYADINIQFSVQCIIISILFRSSFILKVLCGECVPYL